jgi:MFS family permease
LTEPTRQSARFLYLYALAVAGGSVAYIPFLTLLLPVRATLLSGEMALNILAIAAFAGAIAASLANILFGWASDCSGVRRPWIFAGWILSSCLMLLFPSVNDPWTLIAVIVLWQCGLNMMLAPLAAWAGDTIPDAQKGLLGGLLALAPALGAISGALITLPGFQLWEDRELSVVLFVMCMVGPLLIFGRPRAMPELMSNTRAERNEPQVPHESRRAMVRMWVARLLVQIAEASLFAFLLLWFRSLDPAFTQNDTATIFSIVLGVAVVCALAAGRWSDRAGRPIVPLVWGAAIAALGLLVMAFAPSLPIAMTGYVAFGLASSVFLALHSSQTLRVLPRPQTRGRDLGVFNLTNTVPSLIMPWLTLALVPTYGFDALFLLLAGLAVIAALMLMTMPRQFQEIPVSG